jgi:uncharacterized membrane protein
MSLAPLLEAARGTIPLHAFAVMAALVLGIVQFVAPKGTLPHRTMHADVGDAIMSCFEVRKCRFLEGRNGLPMGSVSI